MARAVLCRRLHLACPRDPDNDTRAGHLTRPLAQVEAVLYLADLGLSEKRIAHVTGASRAAIRDWKAGRIPGVAPGSQPRARDCPICGSGHLDEDAYAYLLGMYLGDGYICKMPRDVYRLRIAFDTRYPNIIEECAEALSCMRSPYLMRIGRVRAEGCIVLSAYWKHWPCLFPQHGPGVKHLRRIELAPWQQRIVDVRPDGLLRGLIHSDGWRGVNRVNGTPYPRYQFSNASDDIRHIFCNACDLLGVRWRRMNARNISIARAPDVAFLDSFIGPKT